ncbi:MAG: class C sortase [Lachnospiraceae bacterium]|nr:class C sortase [Lachnospiraceae bacterium]
MVFLKKHSVTLALVLVALTGLGLIVYPAFSDWWNSFHQTRAVMSYAETVANISSEEYDTILNAAKVYNEELSRTGILWKMTEEEEEKYLNQLNIDATGIMGYINIPKINVTLPIYHGTEEGILQTAIGHLEGTSLPVGGKGTHCVVSGHRGLPSARLFTDLDRMTEGDIWTMTVLDHTVTYEVDQIRVVEPSDLSELQIEEGKDYCTLVTCTPYGINTHRLLVRGHRIADVQGEVRIAADALQIDPLYIAPFIAIPVLLLFIAAVFIFADRRNKSR